MHNHNILKSYLFLTENDDSQSNKNLPDINESKKVSRLERHKSLDVDNENKITGELVGDGARNRTFFLI